MASVDLSRPTCSALPSSFILLTSFTSVLANEENSRHSTNPYRNNPHQPTVMLKEGNTHSSHQLQHQPCPVPTGIEKGVTYGRKTLKGDRATSLPERCSQSVMRMIGMIGIKVIPYKMSSSWCIWYEWLLRIFFLFLIRHDHKIAEWIIILVLVNRF